MTSKGKVLFIYPNAEGLGGIPNGIALLSGCLNTGGFETKCFDTTFLNSLPKTYFQRSKHRFFEDADYIPYWGGWTPDLPEKIPGMLVDCIREFKPDIVAVSHVDASFHFMEELVAIVKQHFDIPIIAGGITCTSSPELVIACPHIDCVCIGEGEKALLEFATAVVEKRDYSQINNLWVRTKSGDVVQNQLRPLVDMEELPFQDWSIFDPRHYYKPYCGKFYKTIFVEMARGCHYNCTYCVNNMLRHMYKGLGKYVRTRSIDRTLDEVVHLKDTYGIELLFFIDDNFLGMPQDRFDYFCEQYKNRVDLPFYIQTRSESVKVGYIHKLKDINISTIAIGVEHGNEQYRKTHMNRMMSNENIVEAFRIVNALGIRTTANIIIGMPGECESIMMDTIKLLKLARPSSVSMNFFTPYRGTKMREVAIEAGMISADHVISETNVCYGTSLFSEERIRHYYENLKRYIDCELEFNCKLASGGGEIIKND